MVVLPVLVNLYTYPLSQTFLRSVMNPCTLLTVPKLNRFHYLIKRLRTQVV